MFGVSHRALVRSSHIAFSLLLSSVSYQCLRASKSDTPKPGKPTDPKARKTYQTAFNWVKIGRRGAAIEAFRKANKQDGGTAPNALATLMTLPPSIGQYKEAEEIAREWLPLAQTDDDKAGAHYRIAVALQQQGINDKKDKCFDESCDEFKSALQLEPKFATHSLCDGSIARPPAPGRCGPRRVFRFSRPGHAELPTCMSAPSASSIASIWPAHEWRRLFHHDDSTASTSRWTASPARLC